MKALDRLRTYLGEAGVDRRGLDRYAHLREILSRSRAETLADVSAEISDLLLAEYGIRLAPVRLSSLLEEKELTEQVVACLNALPRVIEIFNRDLGNAGSTPAPSPCRRLPAAAHLLRIRRDPSPAPAPRRSRRGLRRRHLPVRGHLPVSARPPRAVVRSDRRDPQVESRRALPMLLNDLASGVVAGKSSAIYGMVLNGSSARHSTRSRSRCSCPRA